MQVLIVKEDKWMRAKDGQFYNKKTQCLCIMGYFYNKIMEVPLTELNHSCYRYHLSSETHKKLKSKFPKFWRVDEEEIVQINDSRGETIVNRKKKLRKLFKENFKIVLRFIK